MIAGRPARERGVAGETGRGFTGGRLAMYLVAWAALSVALVLLVMVLDPPPRRAEAQPSGGATGAPLAVIPPRGGGGSTAQPTAAGSRDWTLDLSYTPVQSYHRGPAIPVTGCLQPSCDSKADLGTYPGDFVEAVRAQGTGKITRGPHSGGYLGWAAGVGYWLDTAPRDSHGQPLRAFYSAGSGTPQLSLHTPFQILACGVDQSSGSNAAVCARLRAVTWSVVEVPNPGPTRSLTLYVGLETGPRFIDSPWNTTFSHAMLRIG